MTLSMQNQMTVIDFFCGAGGFSEGFRKAGFKIVKGVDNWKPAIETHNLNHNLQDSTKNMLDFEDVEEINKLPNTDIIIGSPPCVLFSLSNHGGNANKELGVRLIKAFYRVIAVKKFQNGSILKAWLMENVPNSRNYVKDSYTFADLDLSTWAKQHHKNPNDIAIFVKNNGTILRSDDYGSGQTRRRFVCGEIIKTGEFPEPDKVEGEKITLNKLFSNFPKPTDLLDRDKLVPDPNYSGYSIEASQLRDHFYDTGVYEVEWRKAKNAKINHPYMGRMSFPENMNKPSRTIMATRSASTREAILYKSDYEKKGDGEYRLPTVREAAVIMGFPISYQFTGNDESTKWRQIGNAVCVQLSYALAKKIKEKLNVEFPEPVEITKDLTGLHFLDDWRVKEYNKPPKRNPYALFRMHPIKSGNMTTDLSNKTNGIIGKWSVVVHSGTGEGYTSIVVDKKIQNAARGCLCEKAPSFIKLIDESIDIRKYSNRLLNEKNKEYGFMNMDKTHPYNIVNTISIHIHDYIEKNSDTLIDISRCRLGLAKTAIPISQVMAIYALGIIVNGR